MTQDEAKEILDHYYGDAPMRVADGACLSVGIIQAIELLGGKYQPGWGITRLPNYRPSDRIPAR